MSNNPQAFPCISFDSEGKVQQVSEEGMTLRDYFAGQAINGLVANFEEVNEERDICSHYLAKRGYEIAESMLKEREKYEN